MLRNAANLRLVELSLQCSTARWPKCASRFPELELERALHADKRCACWRALTVHIRPKKTPATLGIYVTPQMETRYRSNNRFKHCLATHQLFVVATCTERLVCISETSRPFYDVRVSSRPEAMVCKVEEIKSSGHVQLALNCQTFQPTSCLLVSVDES